MLGAFIIYLAVFLPKACMVSLDDSCFDQSRLDESDFSIFFVTGDRSEVSIVMVILNGVTRDMVNFHCISVGHIS